MSSDVMSPEEEEEWKRLEEQINAFYEEDDEEDEIGFILPPIMTDDDETKVYKYESTESSSADRANSCGGDSSNESSGEQKTEGSGHPRYSECTCGYKNMQSKISLRTHSDWCDYRKWREWDDKRKEYANIRIRFD